MAPCVRQLATRIADYSVDVVCGPWSGGAFLAQMIAESMDLSFVYSQPTDDTGASELYSRTYSIPTAFQPHLHGKRIAVVDDVINAGSAVTATLDALTAMNAHPVVVASLMTLGQVGREKITEHGHVVETLESRDHQIWPTANCPLCAGNLSMGIVNDGQPAVAAWAATIPKGHDTGPP